MAPKFLRVVDNLFGFNKLLTESKYYISVLRYVESNNMAYFSPHALFSQARSHLSPPDTVSVGVILFDILATVCTRNASWAFAFLFLHID